MAAVLTLPYPAVRNAWPELVLLLALGAIETARLFLSEHTMWASTLIICCHGFHTLNGVISINAGSKGNLTQGHVTLLFSLLLCLPSLAALLYFLLWQTFVYVACERVP